MAVGGAGNTTGTSKRKPFSIIFVGPLLFLRCEDNTAVNQRDKNDA